MTLIVMHEALQCSCTVHTWQDFSPEGDGGWLGADLAYERGGVLLVLLSGVNF